MVIAHCNFCITWDMWITFIRIEFLTRTWHTCISVLRYYSCECMIMDKFDNYFSIQSCIIQLCVLGCSLGLGTWNIRIPSCLNAMYIFGNELLLLYISFCFESVYVFWLITDFLIASSYLMSVCVYFPFQVYNEQVTTRMEHVNSTPIIGKYLPSLFLGRMDAQGNVNHLICTPRCV